MHGHAQRRASAVASRQLLPLPQAKHDTPLQPTHLSQVVRRRMVTGECSGSCGRCCCSCCFILVHVGGRVKVVVLVNVVAKTTQVVRSYAKETYFCDGQFFIVFFPYIINLGSYRTWQPAYKIVSTYGGN